MSNFFEEIGNFFNDIFQNLLNFLWDLLFILVDLFFGWINIPAFPEDLKKNIKVFLDLLFDNLTLLGFFIRPATLKIIIPLIIFLVNFKWIYHLVMWIIKKIPFLDMK